MADLELFDGPEPFLARAGSFLMEHEAEHNLILGLCDSLARDPTRYPEPVLAVLGDGAAVQVAAIMTAPYRLVVSHTEEPSARELARALHAAGIETPGINAETNVAAAFADEWRAATGCGIEVRMHQRIYRLEHVRAPDGVPGRLRRATDDDADLLARWLDAFAIDIGDRHEADAAAGARAAHNFLHGTGHGLWLWETDEPVSMAGATGATSNGIRIGAVYTPPALRGRGYAGACVAALSRTLLDEGRRFCFLFTDLGNPTSNRIYQAIGYEPVCDVDMLTFVDSTHG